MKYTKAMISKAIENVVEEINLKNKDSNAGQCYVSSRGFDWRIHCGLYDYFIHEKDIIENIDLEQQIKEILNRKIREHDIYTHY